MSIAAPPAAVRSPAARPLLLGLALVALGAGLCFGGLYLAGALGAAPGPPAAAPDKKPEGEPGVVEFDDKKWESAGLRLERAARAPFAESVWRTGRVALNEDRVAHIVPPVDGLVVEVRAQLGQEVQAGDVLAVLDSREVGQAKLALHTARVAARHAKLHADWAERVYRNVEDFVRALAADPAAADATAAFRDRPLGEWREKIVGTYAKRSQMRAQFRNLTGAGRDAVAESNYQRTKADADAAEAAYQATAEQARHSTLDEHHTSEQKLAEGNAALAVARAQLLMLGLPAADVDALDPEAQGAKVSHFAIRAPFAGTVVEKHAVRGERAGPATQMFLVADLTTVWVQADVFENDLPMVADLEGRKVNCRLPGVAATFAADVFYTGDVLDKATRALPMTGRAPNPTRAMKPGQFVEVELTRPAGTVLQVPESAVLRDNTQAFLFVRVAEEKFRRTDVSLGRTGGGKVEVTAGLAPGAEVVVAGGFVLKSELMRDQMVGE